VRLTDLTHKEYDIQRAADLQNKVHRAAQFGIGIWVAEGVFIGAEGVFINKLQLTMGCLSGMDSLCIPLFSAHAACPLSDMWHGNCNWDDPKMWCS
jgi:hypothetical protein